LDELLILVRAIHLASSAMMAGGVIFVHWVARAASDVDCLDAVRRQMRWWLGGNLLVAITSSVAWLALVAARMADRPVSEVLTDGTAWIVLTQTEFGLVWQLRLLCAGLMATMILLKNFNGAVSRWSAVLAPPSAMLYIGGLAWTGHAGAAPGGQGYLHLGADFLHLVAAGAWLGGLPALALLLGKIPSASDGDSRTGVSGDLAVFGFWRYQRGGVVGQRSDQFVVLGRFDPGTDWHRLRTRPVGEDRSVPGDGLICRGK
jgi:putative copper resistance protein D